MAAGHGFCTERIPVQFSTKTTRTTVDLIQIISKKANCLHHFNKSVQGVPDDQAENPAGRQNTER